LYKLGFTKLASVESRLAYSGDGSEALIDRVLVFMPLDDAFDVECQLHSHFSDKRAFNRLGDDPMMPLFKNGQSELYIEDVLGVDPDYSKDQAKKTQDKISLLRAYGKDLNESESRQAIWKLKILNLLRDGVLRLIFFPFVAVFMSFGLFMEFISWFFSRFIEKSTNDPFSPWSIPADKQGPGPDKITPIIEMIKSSATPESSADLARIERQKKLRELTADQSLM